MSGHSKWATIKRKKGAIDAARSQVFQKLAKEIYVAAKSGDVDPKNNSSLRMVIEKAKSANMPNDRINAAIEKAHGKNNTEVYEFIRYEGYGSSGVAIMVDCLTDNRNRTASMVRAAFTKRGGNLGTDGSVAYLFERRGQIVFEKSSFSEDDIMTIALDNGATDFSLNDDTFEVVTAPENFILVKEALENFGVKDFLVSEVSFIPSNYIEVNDETSEKLYNLIESLEELEDVQNVYHNALI